MKLLALSVVVVGACAPGPAERLKQPKATQRPEVVEVMRERQGGPALLVDRPELAMDLTALEPDPTSELRWPLGMSDHPELAPRFDIVKELAEPGMDLSRLCASGAQRRTIPRKRDQVAYLRAWCAAMTGNHGTAVAELAALRNTVVPGLGAAVRVDLPNVIVNAATSDNSARALLKRNGLDQDLDIVDRLAATYVDLNATESARELNELAIANDSGVNKARTCQRQTRRILFAPEQFKSRLLPDSDPTLLGAKLVADPTCRELDARLRCWLSSTCAEWYRMRGVSEEESLLAEAFGAWPYDAKQENPNAWRRVHSLAMSARPTPQAHEFALRALENMAAVTDCNDDYAVGRIDFFVGEMTLDTTLSADDRVRAEKIRDSKRTRCWKR